MIGNGHNAGLQPEWGVMFRDGSVKHPWNGHTAEGHARTDARRLAQLYAPDDIQLACRENRDAPWVVVPDWFINFLKE